MSPRPALRPAFPVSTVDVVNRLKDSTSPYLLQHADNPVDWWPWCEEAFAEAARRDVPVMLSVGYAACHWCHVMAHESFEDPETAAVLNEHVVAVKVDREERPDVDAVYMTATQAMTGQGGWPMTVFMTPDKEPFFCGTYYPRDYFRQLVLNVSQAWHDQRDDVTGRAKQVAIALAENAAATAAALRGSGGELDSLFRQAADVAVQGLSRDYDAARGGFGGAPKFPPSMVLEFLLRHHERTALLTTPRAPRDPTRSSWPRAPARRWPAAACTTSSAAGSPGTRSTPAGSSRTSRRCSTTTPCWPGSTRTCGAGPARRWPAGWPRRPATGCCASCGPPRAGSRPRWTPTARARRASSTSGGPPSCAPSSDPRTASSPPRPSTSPRRARSSTVRVFSSSVRIPKTRAGSAGSGRPCWPPGPAGSARAATTRWSRPGTGWPSPRWPNAACCSPGRTSPRPRATRPPCWPGCTWPADGSSAPRGTGPPGPPPGRSTTTPASPRDSSPCPG